MVLELGVVMLGRDSDLVLEDRNADIAFLPQVCGDQAAQRGGFREDHRGTLIHMKTSCA